MAIKASSESLKEAVRAMASANALGAELANEIQRRGTRLVSSSRIGGGFTINLINTVIINQALQDFPNEDDLANNPKFKSLVCILAHECSHVEQGHWVDSIQQELIAYQAQAEIGATIGSVDRRIEQFLGLDPARADDLDRALVLMLALAENDPATQTIYASLPHFQPTGVADSITAAIKQLAALGIAITK